MAHMIAEYAFVVCDYCVLAFDYIVDYIWNQFSFRPQT